MRIQSHMKHVPKYLLPRVMPITEDDANKSNNFVPFKKKPVRGRGGGRRGGSNGRSSRKVDPLKKFQ